MASIERHEREELYRVLVTEHMRILCGSNASYMETLHPLPEIDVEDTVARVAESAGLEVV